VVGVSRREMLRNKEGIIMPIMLKVEHKGSEFVARITKLHESSEGSFVIAPNGKILQIDDTCQSVFGYEANELVGQFVRLICPKIRRAIGQTVGTLFYYCNM
jgi:PAS domain-containing protein